MKFSSLSISVILLLLTSVAVNEATPLPSAADELIEEEDVFLPPSEDDGDGLVRDRRSNLMAQILYDELRHKLRDDQAVLLGRTNKGPSRRVASASLMMRKRRSTTPLVRDLLASLATGNNRNHHNNNEAIDELEGEIRTLERRIMKRSLMAMILKDSLKQRVEEENKPGRHRDVLWGKTTRPHSGNRKTAQQQQQLTYLLEAFGDILEDYEKEQLHQQTPSLPLTTKHYTKSVSPISIAIRPKTNNVKSA